MTAPSPHYVALVLAAGSARRFGSDKLSAPLDAEPLVFHAIRAARAAPVARVFVVAHPDLATGIWETREGAPEVETLRLSSDALSTSLRAGIAAAGGARGAFVFLGDMPRVPHTIAGELAHALADNFAALPRHAGRSGHPVLLSARAFSMIADLRGDAGAGGLLRDRTDIAHVETDDPAVLLDVDVPADLAAIAQPRLN